MKNILIAFFAVAVAGCVSSYEHNYTKKNCEVIQINDGIATIEDGCGFVWDIDADGLEVGEVVNLRVNDNNTINNVNDDIIIKVVKK